MGKFYLNIEMSFHVGDDDGTGTICHCGAHILDRKWMKYDWILSSPIGWLEVNRAVDLSTNWPGNRITRRIFEFIISMMVVGQQILALSIRENGENFLIREPFVTFFDRLKQAVARQLRLNYQQLFRSLIFVPRVGIGVKLKGRYPLINYRIPIDILYPADDGITQFLLPIFH